MTKRRRPMTLSEYDALLKKEGRYDEVVEVQRRNDEDLQRRKNELRRAEAPLVEELRAAGFEVESAWDLVNTSNPYPAALPILLEHLRRPYPDRVREGIARALAVRDASFGWDALVQLYREEKAGTDAKDGLAVTLAAAAHEDVVDELIGLTRDASHGMSRLLLLRGLKRLRAAEARSALDQLGEDPELGEEARRLLRGGR